MAESMRDRVLKEIISTEETYLRQLDILEKFFEKPCIEKCLLPTNVHTSVFGELSTLRRMNEELYKELTAEDSNVGQAFLHLAPFLKAYSSYANSYQTSLNLLQEWIVRSPELKVWLAGTETRPEVQTKLPSLLITPVQRVPRYRLLLEELRRYTPEDHPHYSDIIGALEEISRVAEHINKCVCEGECVQRMLLLQKAFKYGQPNIIAPGRTLLKEGRLHKVSRKGSGSHERLFFLFSDMLVYTKIPSSSSMTTSNSLQMGHVVEYKAGSLQCCCVLPLKHCTVTPIFGSSNQCKTFRICCESENLVLYSSDADEGNSWLLAIEEAIARLAAKRRTLRKESSSKKPMRRPALRKFTLKGNPNELQVLKATTQTVDSPKTPKCTPPPLPPPPPPPPSSSSVKTVTSPQPTKPPQTSKSPFARAKECFASPKMRLTATSKKKKSKRKHEDVEVSENDEGGFERPKVKLKSLNSHIPTSPQRKWDPRDREQCLLDQFKRPKTVLLPCHLPSVSDGASFPTSPARQLTLQPPNSSQVMNVWW
ncbi:FYVE, RhoGEF and PH domain-containing protein 3-like isoform X2 [Oratosquilla oratoria]|uniref:FYVE, RhoGEF and PH domain-containing protein 3-like isoform X2 n=1 Tax=Oratosquilla oratoria TaxID=337810 RepID=UPI003F777322